MMWFYLVTLFSIKGPVIAENHHTQEDQKQNILQHDLAAIENLGQDKLVLEQDLTPKNNVEQYNLDPKHDLTAINNLGQDKLAIEQDQTPNKNLGQYNLDPKHDLTAINNLGQDKLAIEQDQTPNKNLGQYNLDPKHDLAAIKNFGQNKLAIDQDLKENLGQYNLDPKNDLAAIENLGQDKLVLEPNTAPKELEHHKLGTEKVLASKESLGQHNSAPEQDLVQHDQAQKQNIGQYEQDQKALEQDLLEDNLAQQPKQFLEYSPNATSCEAFLNNTVFDPETVLDVDWKIFYIWSPEEEFSYNIRFSRPSLVLINRFKAELDKETKPQINWTAAELFMESSIDFSALFIKTNVSGMYRLISSMAFEYPAMPMLMFGLKVVKPGYLGIANCKHRFCYALAPVDKMPADNKLDEAAKSIGFSSEYNRSHIYVNQGPSLGYEVFNHDEEVDDDDLDDELDHSKLQIF